MDPSKHFIKVYLKNNTASEDINLHPLPIYGCDLLCPLDNFLNIVKDMVVEDITKACKSQKYGTYSHATLVAAITFVTTVSIVLIVLTVLSCRTLTNKYQYQHNPLWQHERINLVAGMDNLDDDDDDDENVFL